MEIYLGFRKVILRLSLLIVLFVFFKIESNAQSGITRIYTDFNGYWTSSDSDINPIKPDNSHNMLGFVWNGTTYSTGVNDNVLTTKGVSFTAKKFQAFPVKNIPMPGTNSNFFGFGQLYDGIDNGGSSPAPFSLPADISRMLTDGIKGLDISTCVTNIPTTSEALTFTFGSITDRSQIGDGVPDILISQVAMPTGATDQVYFERADGTRIGNIVTIVQNASIVPAVGNWTADFYNPNTGIIAPGFIKTDRQIRVWAADASLFGLTQQNYSDAVVLRYKLGGSSDPAFLAFNADFIQIVSANDDVAITDVNVPVSLSVLENDVPTNGLNVSSLTITSPPTNGSVSVNNTTGVVTYTPNTGFSGIDHFTYQVCNTNGQCDDAIGTITIGSADLAVTKTVSPTTPARGSNVTFVIKATNNGPNDATGTVVHDALPSGYTYVSASTNQYSPNTGNWTIGTLANGATTSLTIIAAVNETGVYSNTATITGTKIDLVEENNTSVASTTPTSVSDRSVTKVASTMTPAVGSTVSFTITATNIGPSTTTNVQVTDKLPSGYSFQSYTTTQGQGTYDNVSGIWNVGTLALNASASMVILVTVNASGVYSNSATISGTEPDPVSSNNSSVVTLVPVPQTDLTVVKTVNQNTPAINSNVVFTLVATNNGPSNATGVKVVDALPTGYTLVTSSTASGSYDATSGEWQIGNLTNTQSVTLTITATVQTTGNYTNTATINGNENDPVSSNNTSTVTPTVRKPDLVPLLYVRPTNVNGVQTCNIVASIFEINSVATSGVITILINRDPSLPLQFEQNQTTVGGRSVQNSEWVFNDTTSPDFYILTTTKSIAAADRLSVGLSGLLTPDGSSGTLTISVMIEANSGGEVKVNNNSDTEKVDYFQQ